MRSRSPSRPQARGRLQRGDDGTRRDSLSAAQPALPVMSCGSDVPRSEGGNSERTAFETKGKADSVGTYTSCDTSRQRIVVLAQSRYGKEACRILGTARTGKPSCRQDRPADWAIP